MLELAQRNSGDADSSAKFGLLQIVRLRFRAFEAKFGRLPTPDEPLFFDETESYPIKASIDVARSQLAQGAHEARVKLDPVLTFLGLAPDKPKSIPRPVSGQSARKAGRVHARGCGSNRGESGTSAGWNRLLANEGLQRRHRITRKELQAISKVSFLGETGNERDYLLILKAIRHRKGG